MLYHIENVSKQRMQGTGYRLHIRCLHIRLGEQIALTGVSGSGKSTALDILGMVLRPDEAEVYAIRPQDSRIDVAGLWHKKDMDAMAALRLRHIGYVLQTGGLLPYLTVFENMALTARIQGKAQEPVLKSVRAVAENLGIGALLKSYPSTLSVGERQRVAIGRALVPQPAIVLADEPTAALDPVHSRNVMNLFRAMLQEIGATLVMVSHDHALVRSAGLREVEVSVSAGENGAVVAVIDDGSRT
ncbi:MAG: ATP-binding cassette domain-containing protein [Desulfovibrio sp.]|jgi:putative ABC transport system ATP-binding protein|nr:ATP-binding cassette domain-containing protein [Desulfovibrio sp.]